MKRLYPLLLLLLPLAGYAQQLVDCAPATPCTTSGPANTGTGDQAWLAFGKINANYSVIQSVQYGGTGAATLTGVLKGNGTSPLTAAASGDIIALWTGTCNSSTVLSGAGTCVTASGSSAWASLSGGTSIGQAFLVGNGSTFGPTGSGLITANAYSGTLPQANGGTGTTSSTGTGAAAYQVSPSFTTPNIGAATATTINGSTIPTSAGTLPGTHGAFTLSDCVNVYATSPLQFADAGAACGSGGGGSIGSGTAGQIPYYAASGTTLTAASVGTGLSLISGTLSAAYSLRVVSGTTDTILSTDCNNGVQYTSSSAVAITLPQATGSFVGCNVDLINTGSGTDTATTSVSTITTGAGTTGSSLPIGGAQYVNLSASGGNWVGDGTAYTLSSAAFSALTSGTNTSAAMLVGTGASLGPTGSGTLTANAYSSGANLAVTGTVSGSGFSNYLASPPGIGGTAPGTVGMTTGTATGDFTGTQALGINTQGDGLTLINSTAATSSSNVADSPNVHWKGYGWNTGSSASQSTDWQAYVLPSSGNPVASYFVLQASVNGGAYSSEFSIKNNGLVEGSSYQLGGLTNLGPTNGMYLPASNTVGFQANNIETESMTSTLITDLVTHATGGTAASASGCSISAHSGGAQAGQYTSGTAGTCTVTLTLAAAPTAYICWARDVTTPADTQTQSGAISTTSVTIGGTTASGDVVQWGCLAY